MADANVRIPTETRDRLAQLAAGEHMSLRAYLARLADTQLTPAERAARAEQARQKLQAWNGYNPDAEHAQRLDAELDRRLDLAAGL
ncbi:hypothetical protein ACI1MP_37765 (plasmid) [Kitasatospora griseola]|uniref:hypothetical protein n=1 Tax=Kitasatospora griseola TaxID=2064 RepID=UPI003855885E